MSSDLATSNHTATNSLHPRQPTPSSSSSLSSSSALSTISSIQSTIPVYSQLTDLDSFDTVVPSEPIGQGSYSIVKKIKHPFTHQLFALKFVSKDSSEAQSVVNNEIEVLNLLHSKGGHPNLISLHGLFQLETGIGLILDFCAYGDVLDFLEHHFKELSTSVVQSIVYQFFNAIQFLHECGIAHRDLKLENILIDQLIRTPLLPDSSFTFSSVPSFMWIKLCDFGFARHLSKETYLTERSGSLVYTSPEVILGQSHQPFTSDLWSAGIVFFALITGQLPFNEVDKDIVIEHTSTTNSSSSSSKSEKDTVNHKQGKEEEDDISKKDNNVDSRFSPFLSSNNTKDTHTETADSFSSSSSSLNKNQSFLKEEPSLTRKRSLMKKGKKGLVHRIARLDYYFPDPPSPQFNGELLLSSDTRALIEQLLVLNPENRLTASQVLKSDWVSQGKT